MDFSDRAEKHPEACQGVGGIAAFAQNIGFFQQAIRTGKSGRTGASAGGAGGVVAPGFALADAAGPFKHLQRRPFGPIPRAEMDCDRKDLQDRKK